MSTDPNAARTRPARPGGAVRSAGNDRPGSVSATGAEDVLTSGGDDNPLLMVPRLLGRIPLGP
jgi:hypothetical protein